MVTFQRYLGSVVVRVDKRFFLQYFWLQYCSGKIFERVMVK